jgi:hypothetical protein
MSVAQATKPTGVEDNADTMAASNLLADRDEAFNTRLGSMRGWQMALERVKPISRHTARLDLASWVLQAECTTPLEVVDFLSETFFSVALTDEQKFELAQQLAMDLGGDDIVQAASYLEEPMRKLLHMMLSLPEYQLG